jgi:hypothetical protein
MVDSPESERDSQERGTAGWNGPAVFQEHPPGPERGEAQKQHRRARCPEKVIETVNGDVRPDRREQHQSQVPWTPPNLTGEDQSRIQKG